MTKLKGWWVTEFGGAALIVAITVFPVFADEGHGKKGHGGHDQNEQVDHSGHYLKHLLKHAKEFGLTPEQIGKLKAIQLDFKRSAARLEADTKVAKLELYALLDDEQIDLKAIQAKVEQLKKSEGACLFEAIKSKRTAMALLTPDQREKDRAHREAMKSEHEGEHGGGMGGGGMMGGMGHGGMSGGGGHQSGMGGMMSGMGGGSMGSGGHGQSSGDHGGVGSSGGQQHQH
ncbi:MAG: periplasmic heavy metal sensor [Nitrospira sp.]|nr:periplasmic heavy metal sensor [Nitrospira sp.]MDH4368506.1 periplasmic heavy metal sensor [Nitrospira sp.]MDH5346487.1 periplasmic heavy metal sensor [Nitrospira sp.]MDH5496102.1 periplasmic heavy metal sensor [Nitrospira sp.]MDH5724893.1 periplasmic heavy metal sensor [Nitrospira sp.]